MALERAASLLSYTKCAATFVAIDRSRTTERFGRDIDAVSVTQQSKENHGERSDFRRRGSLAGGCCRGYHDFDFDHGTSTLLGPLWGQTLCEHSADLDSR